MTNKYEETTKTNLLCIGRDGKEHSVPGTYNWVFEGKLHWKSSAETLNSSQHKAYVELLENFLKERMYDELD